MKKSRYSESQILKIVKEVEGGLRVKEVCLEYGISDAGYYNWKSKYGGMEASDVKRLKELEEENRRLNQMYTELSLDHKLMKDVVERNVWSSPFLQGTNDDRWQFAKMYPASHESGAFDAKAMMNIRT